LESPNKLTDRKPFTTFRLSNLLPWLYLLILACVNIYICRKAFVTESNGHWNSIHGQWISLARIAALDWLRPTWWRYWGGGAPLEFTYAPLIPALISVINRVFHLSPALALNVLTASIYCLGPLAFYLLSWRLSRLPGYSFAAALAWSLASPVALLIPDGNFLLSSLWSARRLHLAFDWDELPHLASLTLLPLAVWSLACALQSRRLRDYATAGFAMSGMMLANMFGVVLTGLVVLTVPLAMDRRFRLSLALRAVLTAALAYVVVSPWVPPSLLMTIRSNAARNGEGASSAESAIALGIVGVSFWIVWCLLARYANRWPTRWMCLFGCVAILIPALGQYGHMHFLPQPNRYKVEAELAIVWMMVFALRPVIERVPARVRILLAFPLMFLAGKQMLSLGLVAERLTTPVDVKQSIEYRSAQWVAENLPEQRVMMGGSMGNFLNAFTSMGQLSAQPYTTAPNWEEQIAVYTIYTGQNSGDHDGEFSLLWLKAFGVQAVAVPGPRSPEYWKPFTSPRKFEGMLPVLWRENDTTIYRVPQRFASLAHVMRPDQLVRRAPIHGLDTDDVQRFVTALDSASRQAVMEWHGANRVRIRALLKPGEIVSTQINYHPGWHATVKGGDRPVHADGIGLMVVNPDCLGDCEIILDYDGGWSSRLCRAASRGILLLLLAASLFRYLSNRTVQGRNSRTRRPVRSL
jgi:hypothetical protein